MIAPGTVPDDGEVESFGGDTPGAESLGDKPGARILQPAGTVRDRVPDDHDAAETGRSLAAEGLRHEFSPGHAQQVNGAIGVFTEASGGMVAIFEPAREAGREKNPRHEFAGNEERHGEQEGGFAPAGHQNWK